RGARACTQRWAAARRGAGGGAGPGGKPPPSSRSVVFPEGTAVGRSEQRVLEQQADPRPRRARPRQHFRDGAPGVSGRDEQPRRSRFRFDAALRVQNLEARDAEEASLAIEDGAARVPGPYGRFDLGPELQGAGPHPHAAERTNARPGDLGAEVLAVADDEDLLPGRGRAPFGERDGAVA